MTRNVSWLFFVLVTISVSQIAVAMPEKDTGNLGEIRQSILAPEVFQKIYGDGWVPMDGRELKDDDDLYKEGLWTTREIPDARGLFLRCRQFKRKDGKGNPEGDLACGVSQPDQVGPHTHSGRTKRGNPRGYRLVFGGSSKGEGHAYNHETGYPLNAPYGCKDYHDADYAGSDHTHDLDIDRNGSSETRPRCLIVNTYIKINRTGPNRELTLIMNAIDGIPKKILSSGLFQKLLATSTEKPK